MEREYRNLWPVADRQFRSDEDDKSEDLTPEDHKWAEAHHKEMAKKAVNAGDKDEAMMHMKMAAHHGDAY